MRLIDYCVCLFVIGSCCLVHAQDVSSSPAPPPSAPSGQTTSEVVESDGESNAGVQSEWSPADEGAPAAPNVRAQGPPPGVGYASLVVLLILAVIIIGPAVVSYRLAIEKGRRPVPWLLVGLVPFLNFCTAIYLAGCSAREGQVVINQSLMGEKQRPVGLVILAVIQFVFTFGLLIVAATSTQLGMYGRLSPLITAILMVVSAVGYLKQDYKLGFIGGNILAIGSIVNVVVFSSVHTSTTFAAHVPSLIYPVVLLCLLNLRYREVFAGDSIKTIA